MPILRHTAAFILIGAASARGQDLPLPQHDGGRIPVPEPMQKGGVMFLKPTTSIKPPLPPPLTSCPDASSNTRQILSREQRLLLSSADALSQKLATEQRVTAALKRIVVMKGPLSKKLDRAELLPAGADGKPVTLVGIAAPTEVVRGLEGFFGVQLTPDNEKKLLDTVRKGMAGASKLERKVEVLGWWPNEGVMAVGVYPEG